VEELKNKLNVPIGEDYLITSDTYNVILNKKVEKKDKDGNVTGEGFKQIGFYPNLEKALNGLLAKEINVSQANTVEELFEVISKAKNEIVAAVKSI
jgi:hypothetical protein